jgi:serine/threonine-protein kinase
MRDVSRRRFVQATGAAVATGALAGCTGNGGGNGNGNDDGNGDAPQAPQEIDDFLSEANLYDGSIVDMTGEDEVTIMVGAGDGGLAFDPPAVRITSSTTVVWEWTGEGGTHNVASTEGSESDFQSEIVGEQGHTFNQSFDNTGIQLYVCQPHEAQGMKGAIEVVEQ